MKAIVGAIVSVAMFFASGAAHGQTPNTRTADGGAASNVYFPPSELNGGWRHLVLPNQQPDEAAKQTIRESAGIDWDKLHAAWQWDLANVGGGQKCLLVIRHGWIAGEWYNERTPIDYIHVASAGKSFVGTCLARLFSSGELSPDDFVYHYLPASWGESEPARRNIKIKHILTMTSGLEPYDGPYEPEKYLDTITSLKVVAKPGTVWAYSTGPLDLMNFVIQKKSGLGLGEYVNKRILSPIGAKPIPESQMRMFGPYAMCSFFRVIPRDWARMGYLLLRQGHWKNEQVLSPESVKLLSTCPDWLADAKVDNWLLESKWKADHSGSNEFYAYTFWLNNHERLAGFPADAFMASGGAHKLVICPSRDMVIVMAGNYLTDQMPNAHLYKLINDSVLFDKDNP